MKLLAVVQRGAAGEALEGRGEIALGAEAQVFGDQPDGGVGELEHVLGGGHALAQRVFRDGHMLHM